MELAGIAKSRTTAREPQDKSKKFFNVVVKNQSAGSRARLENVRLIQENKKKTAKGGGGVTSLS